MLSLCSCIFCLIIVKPAMVDFPPNLEDGERWLPIHVFNEIISGNFATTTTTRRRRRPIIINNTNNQIARHHQRLPDAFAPPSFAAIVSSKTKGKQQVCDTSLHVKPNIPTTRCPDWNDGFQALPGLFRTYHSAVPPQHQGFRDVRALFPSGKREGTGVFLPRVVNQSSRACEEEVGTALVLKNQVTSNSKKASKNARRLGKKCHVKKEDNRKNEQPKEPQDGLDDICLPPEWIY